MQSIRTYRPNKHGEIVLRRWLRVLLARTLAVGFAVFPLLVVFHVVGVPPRRPQDVAFPPAIGFLMAAALWHCSLIRLVLRPGEIVWYGVFRHVVVPCAAVQWIRHPEGRGSLTLETYGGQKVALYWFDGSLWDGLFDFSRMCKDALRAHVRNGALRHPEEQGTFRWLLSWSSVAATLWAAAVAALVFGITTAWH
jgi:hypothetical protein